MIKMVILLVVFRNWVRCSTNKSKVERGCTADASSFQSLHLRCSYSGYWVYYGPSTRASFASKLAPQMHVACDSKGRLFCQPINVGFRAAPHKRLLFAARCQCVARRHKEDCLVVELPHDDWNPYPIKRSNSPIN